MQASKLSADTRFKQRSHLPLTIILLLPLLIISASTMVYMTGVGMPETTKNRGKLVSPPMHIGEHFTALGSANGGSALPGETGRWSLLYQLPDNCLEQCSQLLHFMRQLHVASGKHAAKFDRYLLVSATKEQSLIAERYPRLLQISSNLSLQNLTAPAHSNSIFYLIDPQGFLMMSYDDGHVLKDYITDLKFLFSNSN
ncbi:hypothetical protein EDC56_3215 [Sinobacterium caligoides]|uniref:Cytochrome oxidase Cu insertion factor (SCO1/SenC/PrrC family) n=1 Tax=Sinobacterium caligoides TaxID=933926 RepID=A0A3N2DGQ6_9GAMM|nr:hypothetical protein [Sinobacterium caligoides]ROR98975.1 hypothetical protein EDC56_3215 [Sinobacterium caligoides]